MSAFQVSDKHISAIVTAIQSGQCGAYGKIPNPYPDAPEGDTLPANNVDAQSLGQYLADVNHESVSYRYGHRPEMHAAPDFSYKPYYPGAFSPVQIIKATECYRYQSCEHPGWKDSPADQLTQALISEQISKLPGYDAAAWEIS